jgi:predicted PurR-regulated permease PerM
MQNPEKRMFLAQKVTYILLSVILFLYGLIAIRSFLYPIAFGFLLAYLVLPIANWLEKKGLPRVLANFITIISALAVIVTLILFVSGKIVGFAHNMGPLLDKAIKNLSVMISSLGRNFGFDADKVKSIIQENSESFLATSGDFFQEVFSATTSTAVVIGLLPVYIFLFLYYRTKFAYFLLKIVPSNRKREMVLIMREISKVAARYMGGVLVVVLILMILNSLGLWIIGIKHPIPLGIISALFNFIPYFGTLVGALVPLLYAFLIENDPVMVIRVIILFIIIQFMENNILTPNIVGGNVKVNPFFIITGLVGASMIWGIPGMLLIVPFLAILRIVFARIEPLKPYAYLLGQEGTAKHAITIKNLKNSKLYKFLTREKQKKK